MTQPALSRAAAPARHLILSGWLGSGPTHWQTLWEAQHAGCVRVEQSDWQRPRRGDWAAQLNAAVLDAPNDRPLSLIAHSLGCVLVAWWAATARADVVAKVQAALLVAPPDVQRHPVLATRLPGWSPMPTQPLPFAAAVIASSDDPFCPIEQAQRWATQWGARWIPAGAAGHLNADSGLGAWPAAWDVLQSLMQNPRAQKTVGENASAHIG